MLAFFDQSLVTKVSTDISEYGLGEDLFQQRGNECRPVAFVSRVLTSSETRCSQIEKEALGNTYGCERFHDFIYGKKKDSRN